jgi:predicted NUDIX family NTP pyrophosphohydrolase
MVKKAAGILLYREHRSSLEVFLIHPGGPYWANKDEGSWSIPKGEFPDEEDPLEAAQREFQEETGFPVQGPFISIGSVKQASGKIVQAWACKGDLNASAIQSNTFHLEWPPHSGNIQEFPEADRAEWFTLGQAQKKILRAQLPFLKNLANHLLK